MRISIPLNPKPYRARLLSAVALAAALCGSWMLAAQAPSSGPASSPAHKALHTPARPSAAHALTQPAQAAPAPATPLVPEAPHWPANDQPAQATVVWDSHGLRIDAENSSLEQILKDFSTATGAQVDGMAGDERVFGTYGPGQARDVLSELLQGSGYNVIMIGDQGQGAPRQIVLSVRQAGAAQPAANHPASSDDDADADEPAPVPQLPQPIPPPFRPGFPGRAPQQLNPQEQQLREQQIREQQMQQPANPPN